MFIFTKSLLFYPVDYVSHTGQRFTVSYEIQTSVTWIYSPRISQVLRVHKVLLLGLFSSSAVQMEIHSAQFELKRASTVWALQNSLTRFAPYGA